MQHAPPPDHPPPNLEMSLREQLLASAGHHASTAAQAAQSYPPPPSASAPGPDHPYQSSESSGQHQPAPHNNHLDPNVSGEDQHMSYGMSTDSAGDDLSDPRNKSKRELSTSKRAAQNRAAQRAFRQRKEGYIKKLEEQVKELQTMEHNFRTLQTENYQLREYILNLQSRLLENQSDFPPAPTHAGISSTQQPASSSRAEPPRESEQTLRHELQAQTHASRPAATAPLASPPRHDGMDRLQAAAARAGDMDERLQELRRQHDSPYGLGGDYPAKRSRLEDGAAPAADAKARV